MSPLERPAYRENLVDRASGNKQMKLQEQVIVLFATSKVRTGTKDQGRDPVHVEGNARISHYRPLALRYHLQ